MNKFMIITLGILIPHLATAYTCTVDRYESEASKVKTTIAGPIQIALDGKLPSEGGSAISSDQVSWYVTRKDDMVSVEVRDKSNQPIIIAATEEGSNIRLKVPSVKQILNCNAPGKTNFIVDPTSYNGESISFVPSKSYTKILMQYFQKHPEKLPVMDK